MRAAALDRVGGPGMLTRHVLPVPEVGASEVLIAIHTAGVGSWDADMRAGWWPEGERPPFPLVLGTDGSGRIAAVGSRVRRFAPGDNVYAYSFANPKGGFYAEYIAVAADKVGRPPAMLSLRQAGAVAATGLTAIQGVDDALHVKRGEAVVIHGASGGVGSLALQFAKMRGARVLARHQDGTGWRWCAASAPTPPRTDGATISERRPSSSRPTGSMRCSRSREARR
jgi:NADPH:quinone reductase-like Zn-dependent oxidoreductase